MKHYNIEFKINETEKIVIELGVPLDQIDCCYQGYMKYYVQDKLLCIFSLDTIWYYLEMLRSSIQKGLENKIPLDPSISKDIGYLYNEDCQKNVKSDFTSPEWIGEKYAFIAGYWDEKNWFSSWIYNDEHANIIFEITPKYKWHYAEPEEIKDYISYEEWIKNYKPFLTRIISQETAQQWLDKANEILKIIQENNSK